MGFKGTGNVLLAAVASLAVAAACSGSKSEMRGTADTSSTDGGGMAATAAADAGVSGTDAGMMADAGTSGPDGGMSGMAHDVGSAAGSAARDVRDTASSAGSAAAQGAQSAGQTVADAGSAAMGATRDAASSATSDIKQGASSAAAGASSGMGGSDGGTSAQSSLSDGQILGIASAANTGEVAAAKLALKQTKNAKVKEFANLMVKDHTAANRQGMALAKKAGISPEESDVSRQLKQDGQDELGKLQSLKGKAFDTAYVDAQVQDHQNVLQTIDDQLIPSAQNSELKSMLTKVRATVSEHLDHAKSLQSNLGGGSAR